MQRIALCLVILATIPALSQTSQRIFIIDQPSARLPFTELGAPCQINIVKVSFERPSRFMLVSSVRPSGAPSLSIELANHSAKKVAAIDLVARIKVKDSIYQLDSVSREFPVHLTSAEGIMRLELVKNAVAFDSLAIQSVTYADGTSWQPEHRLACSYQGAGAMQIAR